MPVSITTLAISFGDGGDDGVTSAPCNGLRLLGTASHDEGYGVAVDAGGYVYVTGDSSCNPDASTPADSDMFRLKYDTQGIKQ